MKIYSHICIWMLGSLLLSGSQGFAQGFGRGAGGNDSGGSNFSDLFVSDTLDVQYYYQKEPGKHYTFDDTLLNDFHVFDLSGVGNKSYLNLGFPGSPARPLIPVPETFTGFSLGLKAHDPYAMGDDKLKFYSTDKGITDAFFTKGKTQNDGLLKIQFGRSFKDRIRVTLNFNRYNNTGVYNRQAGKNTNLGVGFTYSSEDQRLRIFGSHYSNIYDQLNNGGITTDTAFTGEFASERTSVPTYLTGASTRDQSKTYQIRTYYQLLGKDSTNAEAGFSLQHIFRIDNRKFKFADINLTDVSASYYADRLFDDRGMRHYLGHKSIINDFSLRFSTRKHSQISVGLRNIINQINQEPLEDKITEWKPYGNIGWVFADRINLDARGELNINKENASFLTQGRVSLDLGKAGILSGKLDINQHRASLLARRAFFNQVLAWDNDFKNIFINSLEASYHLPQYSFQVTAGQVVTNNQIYFDQNGYPQQQDGLSNLLHLTVRKSFKLGAFELKNQITLQQGGRDPVFRVPAWRTENSLDFTGILFKKVLDFRTGLDLKLNESYQGLTYQPLVGQFALEDNPDFEIPLFPYLDFRASFRVRYFRAFVIVHNVTSLLRDDVYYETSRYPYPDLFLRLGISWIFIN